jgi:very-short-patch-repair endonuclease
MKLYNKHNVLEKRRFLRKNMTVEEKMLWNRIRPQVFLLYKFRRQYSVGSYILDFYCPQKKLAIEVDGSQHFVKDGIDYDKNREQFLNSAGISVLRFSNLEVRANLLGVLQLIELRLQTSPNPSLVRRGTYSGQTSNPQVGRGTDSGQISNHQLRRGI